MNLLTFAHRGEAQHFLKVDNYKPVNFEFNGLFKNDENYLLITGEGLESTTEKMNIFFQNTNIKISKVINMGIAGALDENLKLESLHRVKYIYKEKEDETFQSSDVYANVNCISALSRVQSQEYKSILKNRARIVDRELWAIAKICTTLNVPVYSIKLISDFANNSITFKKIYNDSKRFSKQLFDFYLKYMTAKE